MNVYRVYDTKESEFVSSASSTIWIKRHWAASLADGKNKIAARREKSPNRYIVIAYEAKEIME